METTEQALKITTAKNTGCLVSRACKPMLFTSASSSHGACPATLHGSASSLQGSLSPPKVPDVALTLMQNFGGLQAWLSDFGILLQLSEPLSSIVHGVGRAPPLTVTSPWPVREQHSVLPPVSDQQGSHPDLVTGLPPTQSTLTLLLCPPRCLKSARALGW